MCIQEVIPAIKDIGAGFTWGSRQQPYTRLRLGYFCYQKSFMEIWLFK